MIQYLLSHWNIVAAITIVVLTLFSGPLFNGARSLFSWLRQPSAVGGGATPDSDVADLQALKTVQARFDRLNCPEGKAAVVVLFDHFFHSGAK